MPKAWGSIPAPAEVFSNFFWDYFSQAVQTAWNTKVLAEKNPSYNFSFFQVLEWILKQQTEALIEEVTDEILTELVE